MVIEWANGRVFDFVHRNHLVYNTCWEDPRLDRVALRLTSVDTVLAITSAGCNVLDYVLAGPSRVYAVDVNPRQNALLELKIAAIRALDFESFFAMFGRGYLPDLSRIYRDRIRRELTPWSRAYWDRRIEFFANPDSSFYFRGTSGAFARAVNVYIDRVVKVRQIVDAMLAAGTVEQQQRIYQEELRDRFWSRSLRLAIGRDAVLSMVGVPPAQRRQVERHYAGGIAQFVIDCTDSVFGRLSLAENYFWRVYLSGRYTPQCCPEYLKPANFARLKEGLVDRITIRTASILEFLRGFAGRISRFVLLDHMDWLAERHAPALVAEWQAMFDRAGPGARAIWRSGGLRTDYLSKVALTVDGRRTWLPDVLSYRSRLASDLHARDRVHTYGSFYIADLTPWSA